VRYPLAGYYPAIQEVCGLRWVFVGVVFALAGASCSAFGSPLDVSSSAPHLQVHQTPNPLLQVSIGPVQAMVPHGWRTLPATSTDEMRGGFVSSPQPQAWSRMDGSTAGMAATWIDATAVGVPSDFYYLAATGPLLSRLLHSISCRASSRQVFINHRPQFEAGTADAAGDFMATGNGTCHLHGRLTEWAYFIAAPGFGPIRKIGIPSSGLYVVVAVMPESRQATRSLHRLLAHTRFGGAGIADFVKAAKAAGEVNAA
jgi:hypothetical protein